MKNGVLFNEGLERCRKFVDGWLAHADSLTGLIPRNLRESADIWNAKDAAADNYPFMVLTAALTDSALFNGRMLTMLKTEEHLTSRLDHLPDTYSFRRRGFESDSLDLPAIIFGASEYIKDGLLPLTEWLGQSPWSIRMIAMLDDIWLHAQLETPFGHIPSKNVEVNGEMLQVLSRVYWMTKDNKYLDWAIRLGDFYLLGNNHPTKDFKSLRLRDHGCEIVSGLCELYTTLHFARPQKKQTYSAPIHQMLERVLQVGRNEDGLFYDVVDPQNGKIINNRVADNFGYTLNGFYSVYQIDSVPAYREATLLALEALAMGYRNYKWEGESSDGYADAIEGALNLYNRDPLAGTADWINTETQVMWNKQQPDGVIEGWHGDGNFARTTIMYCLWKSKGVTATHWRSDLQIGGEMEADTLWLSVQSDSPWIGRITFDIPRHKKNMGMPYDWPRINQFPEWYTVEENKEYEIHFVDQGRSQTFSGHELALGIPMTVQTSSRMKIYETQQ